MITAVVCAKIFVTQNPGEGTRAFSCLWVPIYRSATTSEGNVKQLTVSGQWPCVASCCRSVQWLGCCVHDAGARVETRRYILNDHVEQHGGTTCQ